MIIGFENIEAKIIDDYKSNKLHHAILLNGKKGIGKASFAKYLISKIIGKINANPDFLLIEKLEDKKEISINQVREIFHFINQTATIKDKFILIDSICEFNKSSANAILKILEEPHPNNFFIIIAHNMSNVLPTIRSRCQINKIQNPSVENFNKCLEDFLAKNNSKKYKFSNEEINFLTNICDNSIALAISHSQDLIKFYNFFLKSILNHKITSEISQMINDKNLSFEIVIKCYEFFASRLIKAYSGLKLDLFFDEREVFSFLVKKISLEKFFIISQESMKILNATQVSYLDKKLSVINIFNNLFYEEKI